MSPFEIGIVLPLAQFGPERTTPRWQDLREMIRLGEAMGVDTLWVPDELVWFNEGTDPQGVWDGVSMAGALAAMSTTVKVGTWVLSALHRNPAIIAKTAETLDEISGGRFVFGLGAGHVWPGQAHAFGLPEDHVFDRFEEALAIIIPLLREGHANVEGRYHAARDLPQRPRGPRPGAIPLLIGGNGPRGQRAAVRHADIWSGYIEERADVAEMLPRLASLHAICEELGRDPATIGRGAGVSVNPLQPAGWRESVISGEPARIADGLRAFYQAGFTQVDLMVGPGTVAAFEAMAPVVELLRDG